MRNNKLRISGCIIILILVSFAFGLLIGMQDQDTTEPAEIPPLTTQWIFIQTNETGYNYTWYNPFINTQPPRIPTLRNDSWLLIGYFGVQYLGPGNHSTLDIQIIRRNDRWGGVRNFTIERIYVRTYWPSSNGGYKTNDTNIYDEGLQLESIDYFEVWLFGYGYQSLDGGPLANHSLIASDAIRVTTGPIWNMDIPQPINTPPNLLMSIVYPPYITDPPPTLLEQFFPALYEFLSAIRIQLTLVLAFIVFCMLSYSAAKIWRRKGGAA